MKLTKEKVFALLPAVFSLLLSLGVMTVFSACGMKEDGTWMRCHGAQNVVELGGFILFFLFSFAAILKSRSLKLFLFAAGVIGAAALFFVPGDIMPLCMMKTMRCHTVFQPFVRLVSAVIVVSGAAGFVRVLRSSRN
ncbi:MAG: DUF4418 family protein [Schwartzia sp.]|nr:DUF4418 family protein [Schwartzia sp. (in: firmicutes)]